VFGMNVNPRPAPITYRPQTNIEVADLLIRVPPGYE
jgi:hypothetical protein